MRCPRRLTILYNAQIEPPEEGLCLHLAAVVALVFLYSSDDPFPLLFLAPRRPPTPRCAFPVLRTGRVNYNSFHLVLSLQISKPTNSLRFVSSGSFCCRPCSLSGPDLCFLSF